ncbi:hybrid sensor histidine kinase/response regulator [Flavobacterium nackdongense]|uniref:histidine kinase n=1 Tax=Flavobacterium nackdongense TaxID=2547394 RepID=A0A4P6YB21_9FLAO|nr:two-component regulator propeller domain-containing protein [Flavobacterium nackdongense]QBN17433.1 hybrid sensor histidine kinase/response regulator [Flavobacterium nackdongense]
MKTKLHTFFLLIASFVIFAQTGSYRLNNLSTVQGLSQSSIIAIHQDDIGQMWFGTRDGLNKYDGSKFTIFRNNPKDSTSISNNDILSIQKDKSGNIWVGTYNGLNCYNPKKNTFKQYFHSNSDQSLCNSTVYEIKEIKNEIWIGTSSGLSIYNKNTRKFISLFQNVNNSSSLPNNFVLSILETKNGAIWVGTAKGLCRLKSRKNNIFTFQQIKAAGDNEALFIQKIKEDAAGNLWIGTKTKGVYKFDNRSQKLISLQANGLQNGIGLDIRAIDIDKNGALWIGTYSGVSVLNSEGNIQKVENSSAKNTSLKKVKAIFTDKKGTVWIGTYYNGLYNWDVSNVNFTNLNQNSGKQALSFDVISSIIADKNQNVYFGTEGGGITILDKKTERTRFLSAGKSLEWPGNSIKSMLLTDNGILWIGTFSDGLSAYDIKTQQFLPSLISPDLKNLLKETGVYVIKKGRDKDVIWLGSFGKGLIRYAMTTKTYQIIGNDNYSDNFLTNNRIRTLLIDSKDNIWIGTQSGLNCINLNDIENNKYKIKHFFFDNSTLSGDDILSLFQDHKDRIWVGTKAKGLYMLNGSAIKSIKFKPGNETVTAIHAILEDAKSNLWLSSNFGIIKYNTTKNALIVYNQKQGLVSNEFNDNACLKLAPNQFYFGGPLGVSYFNSDRIAINSYSPQVILTGLNIKNELVDVNTNQEILENSITYTKTLTLSYDKANFSINFAIPNFINSTNNRYSYRLVGLENNWTTTDKNEAVYTIQTPGTYVFEVRGANNDGVWNTVPTTLEIIVEPAPWRSVWAFLLYFIIIGAALYGLAWIIKSKEILKKELELEHLETQINKENTSAKLQFFTNISHEFRTPLTLILGPLQQILSNYNGSNEMYKKLMVIESSANHLLGLINRLMDFRKFENKQFILESAQGNIVKFLNEIFLSFSEYAKDGNYTYTFSTSDEEILVYYDRYKLERVFYNLISNAFRYTPKAGVISMTITKEDQDIIIAITDSGVGIAEEYIDKIFDLFFEVPGHKKVENDYNKGTGIGLSIVKNIVDLHKGIIKVENKSTGGAIFAVRLPLGKAHLSESEISKDFKVSDDVSLYTSQLTQLNDPEDEEYLELDSNTEKLSILIVEDHKVLRNFIKNFLKSEYNVLVAENGVKGLKKALKYVPDLVISDVIMPEMVGTELCAKIKENIKTSHIPVILLTSRTSFVYKIEGLESGADDYISKPFNLVEFKLRIKNVLNSAQRLKEKFSSDTNYIASEITTSSLDEQLFKKAIKVVEENISNEQFDVQSFCSELGVSRTMLFTKVKAWTNFTPNEFIQEIRMKRAANLLEQTSLNISQVAYKVGFTNPKYFSKCFQKRFRETPSQYANRFSDDAKN